MKRLTVFLVMAVTFSMMSFSQMNKIVGKWKTIDDADGSEKSIVYIFKATNGKYYGKIEHLFKNPEKLCTECTGSNKGKPILGLLILNEMIEKMERSLVERFWILIMVRFINAISATIQKPVI